MSNAEIEYRNTGIEIPDAVESQMFGKPCFKINGKAFICFFQECMVFKLHGDAHKEALELEGSILFDPSGKGRAMKEWVQVTYAHHKIWKTLAANAYQYVKK